MWANLSGLLLCYYTKYSMTTVGLLFNFFTNTLSNTDSPTATLHPQDTVNCNQTISEYF